MVTTKNKAILAHKLFSIGFVYEQEGPCWFYGKEKKTFTHTETVF